MNGAVAAAGGDMAKAALAAGLVDRVGDRREFEARLAAAGRRRPASGGAPFKRVKLGAYVADVVDRNAHGPDRRRHGRRG